MAATAALVYLATLSRNFSGDAVRYAIKAETQGPLAGMDLYHMFNQPLAWLAWKAGLLAGWSERALVPIQVPNALAGGATLGLMFLLARRLGLSARAATVAAAGLGSSCAMWLLATDGEYVTPGLALALLPLVLVFAASAPKLAQPLFALMLGVSLAVAGLAFQTNLFVIPVVLWALFLRDDVTMMQRRRAAGVVTVSVAGLYAAGYGLALGATLGPESSRQWRPHPGMGLGYGLPEWRSLPHGAYALVRSLVGFPGLSLSDHTTTWWAGAALLPRLGFVVWYAVATLLFSVPLVYGLHTLRREGTRAARVWSPLLLWALLSAAFAAYWVPGDLSFWVVVLVPWWLLVARLAGHRPLGAALVALLAVVNAGVLVLPNHDGTRNSAFVEAQTLTRSMAAGDLLMVPVEGRLQVYAYYLTRGAVFVPGAGSSNAPQGEEPRAAVKMALTAAEGRSGRLLVYGWRSDAWTQRPDGVDRVALLDGYVLQPVSTETLGSLDVVRR